MRKADRPAAADAEVRALAVVVAGERLAIPAQDIAEVIRNPAVTRVPLGPPGLLGVANLRGAVIPIVSLAALLGRVSQDSSSHVVVIGRCKPVGLAVDQVMSLERSDGLGSDAQTVRRIDVEALLAKQFGSMAEPVKAFATSVAAETRTETSNTATTQAFFSFSIAGQEFGLPLDSVHEVLGLPATMAVVPQTDDAMLGAITLRDHLLPLVSLRVLLGLGAGVAPAARIVVASIGGIRVGLVVDSLNAIERASDDRIDAVPLVLTRGRQEAQIQAICRLDQGRRLMSILSTEHLLEHALAERLAAESEQEGETMADGSADSDGQQFVIFQLGEEHYGLPIASVSEVVAPPEKLTKLPKAPKFVDGVMNLRGQVVPVIDQRRRFDVPGTGAGRKARVIVVRIGKVVAGFVVDGVSEILRVDADKLRSSPEITSKQSKVIDRIANLEQDGRMILLVDPQELLDRAEQDMIATMHGNAAAAS